MVPSKPQTVSKSKPTPLNSKNKLKEDVLAKQAKKAPKNKLEAELKKLKAENNALRLAASAKENNTLIPRPPKGGSGKGFKLKAAMGLEDDDELYAALRRSVRDAVARAGIDYTITWPKQPKDVIAKVITLARARNDYFKRFVHGWPIEEFMKISLKNRRAYAKQHSDVSSSREGAGKGDNDGEGDDPVGSDGPTGQVDNDGEDDDPVGSDGPGGEVDDDHDEEMADDEDNE